MSARARLRIAQVAPLWARVPPVDYGGTELRVSWLAEELVSRGHCVTLFASGDSRTTATLHSVHPENLIDAMAKSAIVQYGHYSNALLAEALRRAKAYDLIHSHGEVDQTPFAAAAAVPFVYSLRTALSEDDIWLIGRYPEIRHVAMSAAQIRDVPEDRRRSIPVIHNGCRFDDYAVSRKPGSYLAFLGRMGRHKGPLHAIRIARAVNMPLVLAGRPQDATEAVYFEREILPRIDGKRVRHIGAVDQEQKHRFLQGAAALLFPIEWEEPFGNVMIEAMASGVPVVAHARGSVPEVVDPGITGYYGESPEHLIDLVPAALRLDRLRIREHAEGRFGHRRMAAQYLRLYGDLLGVGRIAGGLS